jgi:hypothetical protein
MSSVMIGHYSDSAGPKLLDMADLFAFNHRSGQHLACT